LIAVLLISCHSNEYIASTVNAPIFNDKGQFEGCFLAGTNGFDLQLAYTPIYHLGIIASGSFDDRENSEDDTFHKHKSFEFGLGYYKKIKEKFAFEAYGGYGFGNMEGYYNETVNFDFWIINSTLNFEDYDKAEYRKYFIQPLIGYCGRVFEGGVALRFAGVDMTVIDENISEFLVFWEPVVVAKVGHKHVKFISQLGLCLPIGYETTHDGTPILFGGDPSYDFSPFLFTVGLNVSFGGNKK
ncbi:MAG: hypothetical protein K8R68_04760, partial [Bacteroidales bacterium]|nr:hypothetical protein [Bacteroidales bacterium]